MVTAHDFPSALAVDLAGIDVVLIGDSLAMVALGHEDTNEILLEEILMHCRSVARATKSAFIVRAFLSFVVFRLRPSLLAPSSIPMFFQFLLPTCLKFLAPL